MDETQTKSNNNVKNLAQRLKGFLQNRFNKIFRSKPSSIDEMSERSENTGLLKTSALDVPPQPKHPKMDMNVENSPLNIDFKIVSTNLQKIPVQNETVSSQMRNSSSKERQSTLIEENEANNSTRFSSMKGQKRKLPADTKEETESNVSQKKVFPNFGRIAKGCKRQQTIWEKQLRSAVLDVDNSDWPVFVVRELFSRFNRTFMKATRETDDIQTDISNDFFLPKSFNILCDIDLLNKKEPGETFKTSLPLLILDYKNEIYLLGGNRLESVESELSNIENSRCLNSNVNNLSISSSMSDLSTTGGFLGFDEDYFEPKKVESFDDLDEIITEKNVIKLKDLVDCNNHQDLGLIKVGKALRFLAPNSSIIGKCVGWAEMPFSISRVTQVYREYLLVFRDSEQEVCAFILSTKDFNEWKRQCKSDEDLNKKYKVTGFEFTHKLPINMLPELSSYKPGKVVLNYCSDVNFLSAKREQECNFEEM